MKFYEYMFKQRDREDPVGDLGTDIWNDPETKSIPNSKKAWEEHIDIRSRDDKVIDAFEEAWNEYEENL